MQFFYEVNKERFEFFCLLGYYAAEGGLKTDISGLTIGRTFKDLLGQLDP
jgi:hypothetical protein